MLTDAFYVAVGLVVGWIFLPEPAWVKAIYTKIAGKV
jgi:hypothetical protein